MLLSILWRKAIVLIILCLFCAGSIIPVYSFELDEMSSGSLKVSGKEEADSKWSYEDAYNARGGYDELDYNVRYEQEMFERYTYHPRHDSGFFTSYNSEEWDFHLPNYIGYNAERLKRYEDYQKNEIGVPPL